MKKSGLVIIVALFSIVGLGVFSSEATVIDAWILSGQSNAEGYAITENPVSGLAPQDTLATIGRSDLNITHSSVRFYQGANDFNAIAQSAGMNMPPRDSWHSMLPYEGLAYDWGVGQGNESGRRFGPELSFGYEMQQQLGTEIAIIKFARGSATIASGTVQNGDGSWNDFDPTDSRANQYDKLINTISGAVSALPAGDVLNLRGVLWMQGESDANASYAAAYEANLTEFISVLRTNLSVIASTSGGKLVPATSWDELPVYLGSIYSPQNSYGDTVRAAQVAVAAADSNVYTVDGQTGLTMMSSDDWWGSDIHYSTSAQVLLGERFFAAASDPAAPPEGYVQVWEDEFDGATLNTNNWTVGLIDPGTGDKVPGAAGQYLLNSQYAGYITEEDVEIQSGSLYLNNQKRSYSGSDPSGNYSYTSGSVMSMHKVSFNKGYLQWRAKFPSGDKVWPALWLIAEDLTWGPEWDCFEYFGYKDSIYDRMGMHLLYDEWPDEQWSAAWEETFDATYDCESWHIYGFEWTDTYARWTIDGVEVRYLSNTLGSSWPDEDMYIVMNNGAKSDSPDSTTTWPNSLIVDYVRLYSYQPPPATLNIADFSEVEGDSGTSTFSVPVILSSAPTNSATVDYATSDGTATAGEDYTATSGTLTFTPTGSLTQYVDVVVSGDTTVEGNETFTVTLSSPAGMSIGDATATVVIEDEEGLIPYEYWTFDLDLAGTSFMDAYNSGSLASFWNWGGPTTWAANGAGYGVISNHLGQTYRQMPKNGTINASPSNNVYSPLLTNGMYRMELNLASWSLDAAGAQQLLFRVRDTTGNTGSTGFALEGGTSSAVLKAYSSGGNEYTMGTYGLTKTTPVNVAIEFDFDTGTVDYILDGAVVYSATLTATSVADIQLITATGWSVDSVVVIDQLGLKGPAEILPPMAVDVTSSMIINPAYKGTPTVTLDTSSPVLTTNQFAGKPFYYGLEEVDINGDPIDQAPAATLQSSGFKLQWNNLTYNAGEKATALYVWQKPDFLNGLDSGTTRMVASNDTLSAVVDYFPGTSISEGNFRWVLKDDGQYYISAPNNYTVASTDMITAEALDLTWYEYYPETVSVSAVSNAASPTLENIEALGFQLDATVLNNAEQYRGIAVTAFSAEAVSGGGAAGPESLWNTWIGGYSMGGNTGLLDQGDSDGLNNLTEYAWGGDPSDGNSSGNTPLSSKVNVGGTNYIEYVYFERDDAATRGLSAVLQIGTDLVNTNWVDASSYEISSGASAVSGFNAVTNRVPVDEEAVKFIGLQIQYTP